jgi:transposase
MKQKTTRRKFSAEFKAKVALEAIKDQESLSELSRKFEVSPIMISRWKGEFLANAASVFTSASDAEKSTEDVEKLYAQIGKLKVEVDFLKKVSARLGI